MATFMSLERVTAKNWFTWTLSFGLEDRYFWPKASRYCTLYQLIRISVACWSSSYRLNHHTNTLGLDFGWGALGCTLDRTLTFTRCLCCFQIQQHRRQVLAAKKGAAGLKHPLPASSHRTKSSPTVFSVFKNNFFIYIYMCIYVYIFHWSIIDLQCFKCTARWFSYKYTHNINIHINIHILIYTYQRRRWHPTPVLLPGISHGWRSLVGCSPWGH